MKTLLAIFIILAFTGSTQAQNSGFTENRGQLIDSDGKPRGDILFTASAGNAEYYFMQDKLVMVEPSHEKTKETSVLKTGAFTKKEISFKSMVSFKTSHQLLSNTKVRFEEPLTLKSNYYLPHCPDGITGVRSFKRMVYENIAENTDLVFEISPSGNVESFLKDRALRSKTVFSITSPEAPVQEPNIITDPRVVYATYLGGSKRETPGGIASDSKSNFWVVGATTSPDFPTTDSAAEKTKTAGSAVYISKFSSTGELLYSTYYAGTAGGIGAAVAIDSEDNPVITGFSGSVNFPVSPGAFQSVNKGAEDGYILKLDQTGKRIWATLFGGTGIDDVNYIALDKLDNIIITGQTTSVNTLPVTPGAFQPLYGGGKSDAFIAKFDKSGARLWSTYFGGADNYQTMRPIGGDAANWVTTDSENNIIITGTAATAINFPTTEGAFQRDSSFMTDAFLAKFSPDGQRVWCTLYGGAGTPAFYIGATDDVGRSVAVDKDNNIILAVNTSAKNVPVTPDALVKEPNLQGGGVLVKFTPQGERIWATYYSGGYYAIKTDKYGYLYLAGSGRNGENGFYESPNSIKMPNSNNGGMYIASFKEQQPQFVTTYPRFDGGTAPHDFSINPNGNLAIFGFTNSFFLPVTANALIGTNPYFTNGSDKSFLVILRDIATDIQLPNTSPLLKDILVFPNPVSSFITLEISDTEELQQGNINYTITDIAGRSSSAVHMLSHTPGKFTLDVSSLATGQYILTLFYTNKTIRTIFIKN